MSRTARIAVLVTAIVLAVLAGCASRIAPHDQTIAAGLSALQQSHGRFFDQLQLSAGTPDAAWESHRQWYQETRAEIAALRTRAASHGLGQDPTGDALELLEKSVDELEVMHMQGISAVEVPTLRILFDSQLRMLAQLEAAKQRSGIAEVTP